MPGLKNLPGFGDPHSATIVAVDRSTADWTVITLEVPDSFRMPPAGGAVRMGIVIDGVVHRRHYSPVNAESATAGSSSDHGGLRGGYRGGQPGGPRRPRRVTFAVRRHPDGLVSSHLREHAEPGRFVLLEDSVAEMALPAQRPRDVVLVSGGSGMTPMLAIAETLAAEHHQGRVAWLHYARNSDDVPLQDCLSRLAGERGIDVRIVDTSTGEIIDDAALDDIAPWHAGAEFFLCGPDGLADGLAGVLGDERFATVHRERFAPATTAPVDGDGGTVHYRRSGEVTENPGISLLEGAEAAGLRPAHGCRMGICHTCTATRLSGCTRDLRSGELSSDPDDRIQICVSAPVGDVEMDL